MLILPMAVTHADDKRLTPSHINSAFLFDTTKGFDAYIDEYVNIISHARVDITTHNKADIIRKNSPFFYQASPTCQGPKKAFILIHGLSDSPYSMRPIAQFLHNKCFSIYSVLLVGHGTRPGDLLDVHYKEWQAQVTYTVNQALHDNDFIYMSGYSTGFALAINYAMANPSNINAIIGLSPAIALPRLARFAHIASYAKEYLRVYDDGDDVKYQSLALNAVAQVYALTAENKSLLRRNPNALKNIPILAAISYEDITINAKKTIDDLIKYTNPHTRRIIIYHQSTLPTALTNSKNIYSINTHYPYQKLVGLSHIALPFPANDAWYGANGQYRNCLHYSSNTNRYNTCQHSPAIYWGEITNDNLTTYPISARLSFNPYWSNLLQNITHFLSL